jgi:hypothetical protein
LVPVPFNINIVVAWMAEARPLIDRFRLKPLSRKHGLRIYRNDTLTLIVAGQGKVSAAVATAWLQASLRLQPGARWLNIGIAGHRDLAVGTAIQARSVMDRASGRSWQLPCDEADLPCLDIVTVDAPDSGYASAMVVDMEASGFVETALRFADRSDICCFKVISDNARQPIEHFTPSLATELMAARLAEFEYMIENWQKGVPNDDRWSISGDRSEPRYRRCHRARHPAGRWTGHRLVSYRR